MSKKLRVARVKKKKKKLDNNNLHNFCHCENTLIDPFEYLFTTYNLSYDMWLVMVKIR